MPSARDAMVYPSHSLFWMQALVPPAAGSTGGWQFTQPFLWGSMHHVSNPCAGRKSQHPCLCEAGQQRKAISAHEFPRATAEPAAAKHLSLPHPTSFTASRSESRGNHLQESPAGGAPSETLLCRLRWRVFPTEPDLEYLSSSHLEVFCFKTFKTQASLAKCATLGCRSKA